MFRLIKIEDGITEVLKANEDEYLIEKALQETVFNCASNGDEYTCGDFEAIVEQGYERIGNYKLEIDEVSKLSDIELVNREGGICAHCHSDETDPCMPEMDEGYITRVLNCEICNEETIEVYTLTGSED